MPRMVAVRAGDVQVGAGEVNHVQSSGYAAWAVGAVSNLGSFVAPCKMKVVKALLAVGVLASSANAKINVGKQGDSDAFLDAYTVYNLPAGLYDITDAAEWVDKTVEVGDIVSIELEAATAVGNCVLTLIWAPEVSA